ncbi:MAG: cytochrome c biogenesis protein CcsA, partial [Thermoanaerobaculia bacterium]|nr:cytochrome c biogenesis protein CcsA [Thermoanaerobaculia bacterium]
GSYLGLFVAPPERHMGDVARLLYIHVPTAWNSLLFFTFGFGFAIASLWTGDEKWDDRTVGAVEVGVVLNGLLLIQGMIWAKPTWGIWWTWADVRLVFSFVMLLLFAGVLALRSFVEEPERRASWTAIATIVAWVDVPLVYYCVRWWRSLHQIQSTPETVDPMMQGPMRTNAFAMLFLGLWFLSSRAAVERRRREEETVAAPAPVPLTEGA